MKIETSCNGFYGDVNKGDRTSHNECLCIFSQGRRSKVFGKKTHERACKDRSFVRSAINGVIGPL